MLKVLSPRVHGFLDYVVVALFALAPTLFGFGGMPATVAYALAGIHFTLTVLTAFPMGLVKLVPFKVHGVLEAGAMLGILAAPWIFGFADVPAARNFYLGAGALIAGVVVLTNYQTTESERRGLAGSPSHSSAEEYSSVISAGAGSASVAQKMRTTTPRT